MKLRDLPSVDELARDERLAEEPAPLVVAAAREVLARAREEIAAGHEPGDLAERTLAELAAARAHGWDYYGDLQNNRAYEGVRTTPRFQALIRDMAGDMIARAAKTPRHTQMDLRDIAEAHRIRGELAEAIQALEEAVLMRGPLDTELRPKLVALRAQAAREKP